MTINNQVQLNVLGEKMEVCSCAPLTGWLEMDFAIMTKLMEEIILYVV